jgi:lipid A ethanolaminephosphotransferase
MSLKLFRTTGVLSSRPGPDAATAVTPGWHPAWLLALGSLWMAGPANLPLWQQLTRLTEIHGWRGLGSGIALGMLIFSALTALLSLLAWRWTLKPVLILCLIAAAAGTYFMMTYGVVIDSTMMVNVLQTDPREARDLLSWRLLATLAVLGLLPAIWIWRLPVRRMGLGRQTLGNAATFALSLAALSGALILGFQDISSVMRNHTQLRYLINPLNSFYALGTLAAKPFQRNNTVILPLGTDAQAAVLTANPGKPPLLVLVLGETARTANFALNGYNRPTTPRLAGENIVSQRDAWSCGTSTAASVPCLFSHLGRDAYDSRPANHESLPDVLQHAGLAVLWIDNQSGCKGVCDRIPHVSTTKLEVPGLCENGECFDEVMLHQLDERIAALPAERRARGVVVVMHQMGSHGPAYFKRAPAAFKPFLPECTSNALQDCSQAEVVNAYDNTIVYTDHFLASTIQWLKAAEKKSATAMIYVSDHGESLGENNLYLHGLPWRVAPDVQKRVPWITWLSPSFEHLRGLSTDCLKQKADAPVSHDNYFHSVLGALGVRTSVYRKDLDIYAGCLSS